MSPVRIDASHFSPDTRAFLRSLAAKDVRYLIVGGEAAILHGHVRVTGDVEVFYARDAENLDRLFEALEEFWAGDIPGVSDPADLAPEGLVIQFGRPPNRIDLVNSIDGVSFSEAWPDRLDAVLETEEGDVPLRFIGLGALVKNKRATGRPKDLDDLAYLDRDGSEER